eukprot:2599931-Rhodomonas_salina.4
MMFSSITSIPIPIPIHITKSPCAENNKCSAQNVCDWKDWELAFQRLVRLLHHDTITRADPSEEATPSVSPYQAITFPFTAYEVRAWWILMRDCGCVICVSAASDRLYGPPLPSFFLVDGASDSMLADAASAGLLRVRHRRKGSQDRLAPYHRSAAANR